MSLKGKTAFVTGLAHGQGRAAALGLAREGVNICGIDVAGPIEYPGYPMGSSAELDSLEQELTALNVGCFLTAADVRDSAAVEAAVKESRKRFSALDILVNNAGICGYGLSHELSEAAWDAMLDINLKGPWIVGKAVIPGMIKNKSGVIINNVSVAGCRGMARLSHYAASKWGLTGLTKSWALELAPHGIRVVSIHPTGVNTPMNDGLAALEGKTPQEIGEVSAPNLIDVPWVEPEDIANAVVFLASDKARYITGSGIMVDAGLLTV